MIVNAVQSKVESGFTIRKVTLSNPTYTSEGSTPWYVANFTIDEGYTYGENLFIISANVTSNFGNSNASHSTPSYTTSGYPVVSGKNLKVAGINVAGSGYTLKHIVNSVTVIYID